MISTENFIVNSKLDYYNDTITRYLSYVDLKNKFVYCIFYADIYQRVGEKDIAWLIDDINHYKNIAQQNGKKFVFMVDAKNEATTYRYDLKNALDKISHNTATLIKDIIILSGAYHQLGDDIRYSYSPDIACRPEVTSGVGFDILPNYHFVSLARIAKHHRIAATIEILDRGLEPYGNISLGSGYYHNPSENDLLNYLVPERYANKFPMYIDDIIAADKEMQQYESRDDKIITALVNFVMETGFERSISLHTWNVPFFTEKSIKPFAWGQIPIFVSHANSLQKIRDFGFDLFDDIIDHSYDTELDPIIRIKLCVDQLEKICRWSFDDCRKFKQDNMHRFENNRLILDELLLNFHKITIDNLQKTLDSYDL
jgi:hypothetical protein